MSRTTYDADPGVTPHVGDLLVTKTGIARLIVTCRQVRSRVATNRWAIDFEACTDPDFVLALPGRRALPFAWYPRGKKRR